MWKTGQAYTFGRIQAYKSVKVSFQQFWHVLIFSGNITEWKLFDNFMYIRLFHLRFSEMVRRSNLAEGTTSTSIGLLLIRLGAYSDCFFAKEFRSSLHFFSLNLNLLLRVFVLLVHSAYSAGSRILASPFSVISAAVASSTYFHKSALVVSISSINH